VKHFYDLITSGSVIAAVVAAAGAEPVYVQFQGEHTGRAVAVSLSGGLTFADGSASQTLWAGERSMLVDGRLIRGYSAGLTGTSGDGWYDEVPVSDGASVEKVRAISALFAGRAESSDNSDEAATLQAMLWEIVYDFDGSDRSIDMAGGDVSFGLIDGALFDAMKRAALGIDWTDRKTSVTMLSSDKHNGQLIMVPLPSGAGLAGLGLLGFASWRRRWASSLAS
jgi:hypothetical protein